MIGVLIASKAEWKVLLEVYNIADDYLEKYPYGEYYTTNYKNKDIVFFRSGVRKVNAAGAVQYMIDKFDLDEVINLGVCTSACDELNYGDVLIPEGIINYDYLIRELTDEIKEEQIKDIEVPNISLDHAIGVLGTSDKSLVTWRDYTYLSSNGINASDKEAEAIYEVCNKNNVKCIIIKGVSDKPIKGEDGINEQMEVYEYNLPIVMKKLIEDYLNEVI